MDLRSTIPRPWLVCRCVSSGVRGVMCPSRPPLAPLAPSTTTTFPLINHFPSNSILRSSTSNRFKGLSPTSDKRPRTPDPTSTPTAHQHPTLTFPGPDHTFLFHQTRTQSISTATCNSNRPSRSHQTRSDRNQVSHEP
jgi:hypothetical protein